MTPLDDERVRVVAIVTGVFQDDNRIDGDLDGFFLQEEDADSDGDPATSEGIFVFDGSSTIQPVQAGDLVEVVGTVSERFSQTQLSATMVSIISSGNPLPSPAVIAVDPDLGLGDLERYEGMRIRFTDPLILTESFNLDRFGEVRLFAGQSRPYQYTQIYKPDVDGFEAYQDYLDRHTIVYDDGFGVQNRYIGDRQGWEDFNDANAPRHGDAILGASGVLQYSFDEFRILPTSADSNTFTTINPRPSKPPSVGGTVTMASVNVLNFFVTLDENDNTSGPANLEPRGADSTEEFERQVQKLTTYLLALDADILALAELENNFPETLSALADAVNEAAGSTVYAFVDPGVPFVDQSDAISVGFLYKPSAVMVVGEPAILSDAQGDSSLQDFLPIFDGPSTNRATLAATFATYSIVYTYPENRRMYGYSSEEGEVVPVEEIVVGECLTVAAAHLKSKGFDPASVEEIYAPKGDGAAAYNLRRLYGAQAIDLWLQTEPTGFDCANKAIAGDLKSYALEDPIVYLQEAGYRNVESPTDYSYIFDGQLGTLDYVLVNAALFSRLTGAGVWHINEDEVDYLDYNLDFGKEPSVFDGTTPARASDHSPVLIGLDMTEDGGAVKCGKGGKGGKGSSSWSASTTEMSDQGSRALTGTGTRNLRRKSLMESLPSTPKDDRRLRTTGGKGGKFKPIDLDGCRKNDYYAGFEYDCIGLSGAGTAILDLRENFGGTIGGTGYCCEDDCKEYSNECFAAPFTMVGSTTPCDYVGVDPVLAAAETTPRIMYTGLPLHAGSPAGICNGLERPSSMKYDGPLLDVATSYDAFYRLDIYCCVPPE